MRELRKKKRLTQKQLGYLIGVNQSYISKIENGNIKSLTIGKFLKLAKVLGVKPEELLQILLKNQESQNG